MQNEYDLVIIGSGAGGAPIAHELARKGKSVLMLEKGPLILPQYQATTGVSGFRRDEAFSTGAEKILRLDVANKGMPYYSSHVEPDLNDEPHIYRRAGAAMMRRSRATPRRSSAAARSSTAACRCASRRAI